MTIFWRPDYILRHKDGSRAYYPSWDVDAWWYCGEFKVTAYQFVLESAYVNADGTLMSPSSQGTTDQGTSFSTSGLFARDVEVNGTGRADISQPCIEQDNYISNLERAGSDFTCTCGKGRDFDPDTDAYKVVATDLEYLRMGAQIYAPDLEDESDPRGNADFTVKDTGGRVRRYHIDVFTGEGPGILAGDLGSVPSLQYTAYHHYQRGVPFAGDALGPLAVYQKSQVHWFFYICD